jgi:hypothetical protein
MYIFIYIYDDEEEEEYITNHVTDKFQETKGKYWFLIDIKLDGVQQSTAIYYK